MKVHLSKWNHRATGGFRQIASSDLNELGDVMLDAYRGTIDYNGESIAEARTEIAETFHGKYGKTIENACLVAEVDGQIAAAIIFNWLEKEQMLC